MDEGLWSTRNIAEYAYCPRLFYLMEVEGIHIASADTEQGKAIHEKVDKPSRWRETEEGRQQVVRSLALSSPALGITATLDLAEIDGKRAVPVEYRKGRPRHTDPEEDDPLELGGETGEKGLEPWPTDRVQIGLQALLLREAGFEVEEGVIYYAAEKRKLRLRVGEELLAETMQTLEAAKSAALGARPLPLENDSRCRGCSLQPVCLPDEVNAVRREEERKAAKPRALWPPRQEGMVVAVQQESARVGVSGKSLRVISKEGKVIAETPLAGVESLAVRGRSTLLAGDRQTTPTGRFHAAHVSNSSLSAVHAK